MQIRGRRRAAQRLFDNRAILLMGDGGSIRRRNMRIARVTEDDLRTHRRAANVSDLSSMRAIVMDGTDTIALLHGSQHAIEPAAWILSDVRDYED